MQKPFDAVVVGAGIAGLTLATSLQAQGLSCVVLEKSKGVGGRMATRRDGDAAFDHGAQFYRVRAGEQWDSAWAEAGLTREWFNEQNISHRASPGGMTKIAKALAAPLDVRLGQRAERIEIDPLTVALTEGEPLSAHRVYLSCPLPQSLEILRRSSVPYPPELDAISYAPALIGLFRVESHDPRIQEFTYREFPGGPTLFSVANQKSKGVSAELAFTATMEGKWSGAHFENEESESLRLVTESSLGFLSTLAPGADFTIVRSQLKKWRYSHPLTPFSQQHLALAGGRIVLLGDAFGGASIAGAIRSASSVPLPRSS